MEHAMKKMIKRLVQQNKLPMFLFNLFSKLNLIFIKIFIRELKEEVKSYGNLNPDDTIYIIRIKPPGEGFYSNVFHVLSKIKFAISRGFIPVVDMLNYSTIFHDKGFRGNLWERYYSQPCNLNLEDAYKSLNVILSSGSFFYEEFDIHRVLNLDKKYINSISEVIKKYIKLNEQIEDILVKTTNDLLLNHRVLGVKVRGSDYNLQSSNHFNQPKISELFEVIDRILEEDNYGKIYIATEESQTIDIFKDYYKDKIIFQNIPRIDNFNPYFKAAEHFVDRFNDRFQAGIEYLIDINTLANCKSFVAGKNGGTAAVLLVNDLRFERIVIL